MIDSFEKHLALNKFRMKAEDIDEVEDMLALCREFIKEHDPNSSLSSPSKRYVDDMTPDELVGEWSKKLMDKYQREQMLQKYNAPIPVPGQQTPPPFYGQNSSPPVFGQNSSPPINAGNSGVNVLAAGAGGGTLHSKTYLTGPKTTVIRRSQDVTIRDRWSHNHSKLGPTEEAKEKMAKEIGLDMLADKLIDFDIIENPHTASTTVKAKAIVVNP